MTPTELANDPADESLGALIRSQRELQGLSLRQLAQLVAVDHKALARWESNDAVPKAKYLSALSRALEIPTSDLMLLSGAEYPHDAPSLPAMLRAEYDLPAEAIAEVEAHIEKVARRYRRDLSSPKGSNVIKPREGGTP